MTKTDIEQAITIIKSYKEVGVQDQAKLEEALQTLLSFASSALSQESKVKLSACCQEPVAITTTEEGTNYFTCSKCIRPCDLYIEPSSALEREVCPECGGKGGRSFADRPAVELGWVQCRKCSGTGTAKPKEEGVR
jgi:DnaJ-class molecular chaperone